MSYQSSIKLNIAICDDDPAILPLITKLCNETLGNSYPLQICAVSSPEELLNAKIPFHIAILDVQIGEINGLQIASQLLSHHTSCQIIFISGFLTSVSAVYEVSHIGLVLKQFLREDLPSFLLRAAGTVAQVAEMVITVRCSKEDVMIPRKEIILLERRGHWTYITLTNNREISTREKLSSLNERLGSPNFLRCHISYIVNLDYVEKLEGQDFCLVGDKRIPISRSKKEEAHRAFFQYLNPV